MAKKPKIFLPFNTYNETLEYGIIPLPSAKILREVFGSLKKTKKEDIT